MIDLSKKKLFLFDLDGVLLAGKERSVKLGGTKVIGKIRSKGKKILVLTNNSTDTVETVHARLRKHGIPVEKDEILTSARLTAEYVGKRFPGGTFYLIGELGFQMELDRQGLMRTRGAKADVVVVGLDRKLTYSKLDRAAEIARNGAQIVATHSARLYMYRNKPAIAVGPILKAVEFGANKKGVSIGKPSALMFELALELSACRKEEAVMVGDQEDTDVEGAKNAGIQCILVSTGVYDGRQSTRADGVVKNVDDIAHLL